MVSLVNKSAGTRTASTTSKAFVRVIVCAAVMLVAGGGVVMGQATPVASVFSSVGGSYSGTYAVGTVCGGTGSGSAYKALDTLGNGCPAKLAKFGATLNGLGVDGAGNIFFADYTNGQVRKIDVKTTVVTTVVSTGNAVCSATASATGQKQDGEGAGCVNGSALGPATTRGMTVDPWGNVIVAGYNTNETTVACLATSPLCPGTSGRKQPGSFYRVAGCIGGQGNSATASSGTTAYTAGDGGLASPYQNLAGDVTAWGLTGTAAATATVGTANTTTCTSGTSGGVNSPRGAQADKFGNVYIADTNNTRYRVVLGPATYAGVTNPLFAIIQQNPKYTTPTEGYIYPILGGFASFTQGGVTYNAPTAAASACSSASTTIKSNDAFGDGCQWFETAKPTGNTSFAGMGVDNDGNPIFSDTADSSLRVMYVQGTKMAKMITAANPGVTPTVGTMYALVGVGTGTKSGTPQLNITAASLGASNLKLAVDGSDNIYLSDGAGVNIVDSNTGFLRRPITTGGTTCTGGASNGDGCAAGNGVTLSPASSVGESIAVDNLGNVYFADSTTTGVVRKALASSLYPTAVGSTFNQTIVFHEPAGTTSITPTLINASPGITLAATQPACTVYSTTGTPVSDGTADCGVALVFAPTVAGTLGATLSVVNTGGGGATMLYPITGTATAAALTTDVAAPATATYATLTASAQTASLVFDSGGNLYTVDNHANTVAQIASSGTITTVGTAPAGVTQVAVDASGNVYTASPSGVTTFANTGAGTWAAAATAAGTVTAIVYDAQGNAYTSNGTSVVQTLAGGFASLNKTLTLATGLSAVTQLTFDGQGNLLIADTGVVYRLNPVTGGLVTVASSAAGGVTISGLTPKGIAGDAAGDVYVQDGASKNVYMIAEQQYAPATATYSGNALTVLGGEKTPGGLAVDGLGQVYVADAGLATPAILQVKRSGVAYTFPTTGSSLTGTITNSGNVSATGTTLTGSGPSQFVFTPSSPCTAIPSSTSGLLSGGDCAFSVTFNSVAGTNNTVTGVLGLTAAGTPLGALTLSGVNPTGVTTLSTTTAVSGSTSSPYTTGTESTYTVTVTNTSSTNTDSPSGNVSVSIDGGAATAYALTAAGSATATASFSLSGLMVKPGGHSIAISYASTADGSAANTSFGASSTSTSLTVTQVTPAITWSPGASSVAYSAPVGLAALNATASVAGVPVYTANGVEVNAASYLAVGSYTLAGTFYPTDSVDYTTAVLPSQSFAVNAASTTAPIGGSTSLVAADGTGNYTTVQAAVNALGTSGGSVYIKPGTYGDTQAANDTNGSIMVSAPNVALRGLGGDPTQVILTHGGGAFGSSYPYTGQFTAAQSNGSQLPAGSTVTNGDEGSATLVVARTVNTALGSTATLTPNNFYAENLTINNVWNTDNVGTTTTYLTTAGSSGSCAVQTTAMTFSALYNAQQECASQALAIWITSDTAVLNNVYMNSLQDTVYAAAISAGSAPSRQFWFRGKIAGDVDYIFGDAAVVFDHTSIYSAFHGNAASGVVTIEAQSRQSNYLSGYVMNSDVFTSQAQNMTALYFGRPYNTAGGSSSNSTWVMLNSYVDQVTPIGYVATLGPTLTGSNYGEYNDAGYTDPAVGSADMNGVLYTGVGATPATGGNSGAGVLPTSAREAASTDPLYTPFNANGSSNNVGMTPAQAQQFYPMAFLGQTIATTNGYNTVATWSPTAAIAADVNGFVPSSSPSSVVYGTSLTVLMRPQTPGLGAINTTPQVTYTVPTGTYSLSDGGTVIASGNLDAAGEASYTSTTLAVGAHSFTWAFTSGDSNFASSATTTPYNVTVTGLASTTTVAVNASPIVYGQSAGVTATVSGAGTNTGTVTLTVDGGTASSTTQTAAVSNGNANFTVSGLLAGAHTFAASYGGGGTSAASASTSNATVSVTQAPLAVSGSCNNRIFDQVNVCSGSVTGSYQYSDTAATVVASLGGSTGALRNSVAGSYAANPVVTLTAFGSANYTVAPTSTNFTIAGGAPQTITFRPLPNLPVGGTYQLTGHASSGLPLTYTIDSSSTGTATIVNGTSISVTGAGTIKVNAAQSTDPTGDYAAATTVSRSFTAQ